jgi:sterol desaturase/sphingolipid hydroxylase (fatty acid hydroxylase superfamily)
MFSGIQEILLLVIIILGILFLPRILNRGSESRQVAPRPAIVISGKMRLAVAASAIWPAMMAVFLQPWKQDLSRYLYLGVGPVALIWIIYWVLTGFRKK